MVIYTLAKDIRTFFVQNPNEFCWYTLKRGLAQCTSGEK